MTTIGLVVVCNHTLSGVSHKARCSLIIVPQVAVCAHTHLHQIIPCVLLVYNNYVFFGPFFSVLFFFFFFFFFFLILPDNKINLNFTVAINLM